MSRRAEAELAASTSTSTDPLSVESSSVGALELSLDSPEELALARQLLRLEDVLRDVETNLYPNKAGGTLSLL